MNYQSLLRQIYSLTSMKLRTSKHLTCAIMAIKALEKSQETKNRPKLKLWGKNHASSKLKNRVE